jgi:uncharacterized membrane protein YgcG
MGLFSDRCFGCGKRLWHWLALGRRRMFCSTCQAGLKRVAAKISIVDDGLPFIVPDTTSAMPYKLAPQEEPELNHGRTISFADVDPADVSHANVKFDLDPPPPDADFSPGGGSFGGAGASGSWDPPAAEPESSPSADFSDVASDSSSTGGNGDGT